MTTWWLNNTLAFLVWPGLIGGALLGWFYLWLGRKLIARFQARQGPPFYQPFFDFFKLMSKQTIVPGGVNPGVFYGLPLAALFSIILALALTPVPSNPLHSFSGDLVLLLYLLEMPALCDIIAGFATRSLYAQVGAAREAILSLGYNLPFLTALIALALQADTFRLADLATAPLSPTHIFAGIALLLAIPAKIKTNPFSIPNAESEIVAGIHVEYNSKPLAILELVHGLEIVALVNLFAALFLSPFNTAAAWLVYLLISFLVILGTSMLSAATARLKVQHAFRFYWSWGALAAILALVSALIF